MKVTTKFLIFIIIFGLISIDKKVQTQDITVTGSWFLTIDASDLQAGAGSDLNDKYTSANDAVHIDISNTSGNWRVDVRRADSNWHSDFILKVKRNSDGTGSGTISGGTTEVTVPQTDQEFFTGSSDRDDVHVELTLENVSVQIPPDNYTTTVYYTVVDI
jgi:hypothetical protein